MFEFVPLGVAVLLGAYISRRRMRAWPLLMAAMVVAVGLAATICSGEYVAGWVTLPNDVALATFGAVLGGVAARGLTHIYRFRT
jgi:hypothetical protein